MALDPSDRPVSPYRQAHDWQWPKGLETYEERVRAGTMTPIGVRTPAKQCTVCGARYGEVAFKTDCYELLAKKILDA